MRVRLNPFSIRAAAAAIFIALAIASGVWSVTSAPRGPVALASPSPQVSVVPSSGVPSSSPSFTDVPTPATTDTSAPTDNSSPNSVVGPTLGPTLGPTAQANPSSAPAPNESQAPTPSGGPTPDASGSPTPTPGPAPPSPTPAPTSTPTPAPTAPPPPTATPCPAYPSGSIAWSQLGVNNITSLAMGANNRLFWAERTGVVRVWQNGGAQAFADVSGDLSTSGSRGLLGIATSGSYVYAFYSQANGSYQRVVRWLDCGGVAQNEQVIVSNISAANTDDGGSLAFDPSGYLYVTVGDNGNGANAQDGCRSWLGKVVRFTPLGAPAGGCWVSGLHNSNGIAFSPSGLMGLTNWGPIGTPCPECGDEFYLVGGGGIDYQWPFCWGYSHLMSGFSSCNGLPEPQFSTEGGPVPHSTPNFVKPMGVTYATSGAYAGHFLFCANAGDNHVLYYNGNGSAHQTNSVLDTNIGNCGGGGVDVKQGTDGYLYYTNGKTIFRTLG